MSQNDDQCYIDKTINGDTRAFGVLVDRYKYMVFTLAMKIVKNKEEAEEVSQDVFIKVYQVLNTFKGGSKFSTWIYRITYNRSLDYLKKRGRSLQTSSLDDSVDYLLKVTESVLDDLEADERKNTIKEAMKELASGDGVVLTLYYFEELSLKEISKIMDITVDAVKVRLFRSRKRLAIILERKLEPQSSKNYERR